MVIEVLIGLPGSGKSTYATEKISTQKNLFSSDNIREEFPEYNNQDSNQEIFNILYERLNRAIEKDSEDLYIFDATNLNLKDRRAFFDRVKLNGARVEGKVFNIPFWRCLHNNFNREREVPQDVLYRYREKFQFPVEEEGFDQISFLNDIEYNSSSRLDYLTRMNIGQDTPYHNQTILDHCQYVRDMCVKEKFVLSNDIIEAALWHDYGKIKTKTIDDQGIAHYYNHANVGAYDLMNSDVFPLYFDKKLIIRTINYHMLPFDLKTFKAKKRWEKRLGRYLFNILLKFNVMDRKRLENE